MKRAMNSAHPITYVSPLQWPMGWPRTASRVSSKFRIVSDRSVLDLEQTMRRSGMDARTMVVSTQIAVSSLGRPFMEDLRRRVADPGVAIFWSRKGVAHTMACDRYLTVAENIRAITLALEGLRAVERAGVTQVLDRAFAGFAQLPSSADGGATLPPRPKQPWWRVLGWDSDPLRTAMSHVLIRVSSEAMYKSRVLEVHPDQGGTHDQMVELNAALAEMRAALLTTT
jgi:hypothetical protein